MKRIAVLLFFTACAGPQTAYTPEDPLARSAKAERVEAQGAAFSAVFPDGFKAAQGQIAPPMVSMHTRDLPGGEAAVMVEWYPASGGVTESSFLANMGEGAGKRKSEHEIGGRSFAVVHGLDHVRYAGVIQRGDPYQDALGARAAPPRLSLFERRRYLEGGDAYRLYRCKKKGAWGLLNDYRRAQAKGKAAEFRNGLTRPERQVAAACFGKTVALDIEAGRPVPKIAKPTRYRLNIMARDEWIHGAGRFVDRECVHLRPAPAGFWVLRYRAPRDDFAAWHGQFERFMAGFSGE